MEDSTVKIGRRMNTLISHFSTADQPISTDSGLFFNADTKESNSQQRKSHVVRGSMFQDVDVDALTTMQLKASYCLMNPVYQCLMMLCILAHMILTVFETDQNASGEKRGDWQSICEKCFMSMYVLDLLTRMYIQHWAFFKHRMNIFDLFIVSVDIICAIMNEIFPGAWIDLGPISLLRALRTLRIVRVMRNFNFSRDLYLMLKGMAGALRPILFAFLLTLGALTIFSIAAVEVINPVVKTLADRGIYADCDRCPHAFSSVMRANLTFFSSVIAGDSWGKISIPIMEESPLTAVIIITAFGTLELGLLNVVVAVVVDRQAQAREEDKELQHTLKNERIKASHKELLKLFRQIDWDGSGALSYEELQDSYKNMETFRMLLKSIDVREDDLETIFASMDRDRSGSVDYQEFVMELHRIRSVEMRTLIYLMRQNVLETKDMVLKLSNRINVVATREARTPLLPETKNFSELPAQFAREFTPDCTRAVQESSQLCAENSAGRAVDLTTYDIVLQVNSGWEPLGNMARNNENSLNHPSTQALGNAPSLPSQGLNGSLVKENACCDNPAYVGDVDTRNNAANDVGNVSAAAPRTVHTRFKSDYEKQFMVEFEV